MHMALCPAHVILARLAGRCAPCSVAARAGHEDDEGVLYLRHRGVNVMQSGCRVGSQKRNGYGWSTSPCRKLGFACACAEGLKIARIRRSNSSHGAWKDDDQQYPGV